MFAAALIIIVVLVAIAFTRPTTVSLPVYLDRCIPLSGPFLYKSTPQLTITINGVNQTIPDRIGILGQCVRPIYTLAATGTIHINTDEDRTYTLGDFFLVWGNTFGPDFATFNRNQLFYYRPDSTHSLTMTVNGTPDNGFQDYSFPRNANTTTAPVRIVIRYG